MPLTKTMKTPPKYLKIKLTNLNLRSFAKNLMAGACTRKTEFQTPRFAVIKIWSSKTTKSTK